MEQWKVDIMNRFKSCGNKNKIHFRQRGFGLLELLIAMSILAIGTLGIMKLQMQSGLGNADSRNQGAATNLARSKMEELKRLESYTVQEGVKPDLVDPDSGNDLGNWSPPDYSEGPFNESQDESSAKIYTLSWNVVDDFPITDFKTVRVRVSWNQGKRARYVDVESQVGLKDLEYFE